MIHIKYDGPRPEFSRRHILGGPCAEFLQEAVRAVSQQCRCRTNWTLHIDATLLFDANGLRALLRELRHYRGGASRLAFRLKMPPQAYKDYYSLSTPLDEDDCIALPVYAERHAGCVDSRDTLQVQVPHCAAPMDYPVALADRVVAQTPLALLLPYQCGFDVLFANQIALFSQLAHNVPRSPRALLRAALSRGGGGFRKRATMAWTNIHPTAEIHPSAVVEGSVIESGARIGAHCVVRCSHIGSGAQLLDGAKVEYSVVGAGSWLMHDLVLIRSHVEQQVFLIHGPYQFSSFHHGSAAFATIMMDYRPDERPIRAAGTQPYSGRFLGALLEEGAKSLGGSLLAPGIVVPKNTWLACDLHDIHRTPRGTLPTQQPLAPASSGTAPRPAHGESHHSGAGLAHHVA